MNQLDHSAYGSFRLPASNTCHVRWCHCTRACYLYREVYGGVQADLLCITVQNLWKGST